MKEICIEFAEWVGTNTSSNQFSTALKSFNSLMDSLGLPKVIKHNLMGKEKFNTDELWDDINNVLVKL